MRFVRVGQADALLFSVSSFINQPLFAIHLADAVHAKTVSNTQQQFFSLSSFFSQVVKFYDNGTL